MLKRTLLIAGVSATVLTACAIDSRNYAPRGRPESLLDVSAERVTFGLSSRTSPSDLQAWINNDQPSRADLNCSGQHANCEEAEMTLHQFGVPYEIKPAGAGGNEVVLYYDRLVTTECEGRFVNNHYNPFNLNHENMGCSVASNVVQMVGDHRQFTSPAYQDPKDAEGAVRAFDNYLGSTKE